MQARIAYLVNSTPKYYYILPLHFALLRRYASALTWDLFLATEDPAHPIVQEVAAKFQVKILPIPAARAGFLESRLAALELLRDYPLVLPMQEDFLLDRAPDADALQAAVDLLTTKPQLASVRLMPCPGPAAEPLPTPHSAWAQLTPSKDTYMFVFQATLWRTESCKAWYETICAALEQAAPAATTSPAERRRVEIWANIAENATGQAAFAAWATGRGEEHWAWVRRGLWSNAVYLSPWPYRPTAIVKGKLEAWAQELGKREGYPLNPTS